MSTDLFWFVRGTKVDSEIAEAALEAYWLMNNKLLSHLCGVGSSEGAD